MRLAYAGYKSYLSNQRIRVCAVDNYRLLILDGHGSHLTPKIDPNLRRKRYYTAFHTSGFSHLLQPLYIGCFAVLKRAYGRFVGDFAVVAIIAWTSLISEPLTNARV